MRIAVLIISLCLVAIIGVQSCGVMVGGSLTNDANTHEAGAVGILVAFLFVIGAAFALRLPRVSMIVFALAAVVAFIAAGSSRFVDLSVWGWVSVALSVMSFFGRRELLTSDQQKVRLND